MTGDGGEVDDMAVSSRPHAGQDQLGQRRKTADICLELRPNAGVLAFFDRCQIAVAGIVISTSMRPKRASASLTLPASLPLR